MQQPGMNGMIMQQPGMIMQQPQMFIQGVGGVQMTMSMIPMNLKCFYCGYHGMTRCFRTSGTATWATFAVCCLLGCWLCAPCMFCIDNLKDYTHFCTNCNTLLAIKKPC